MIAPDVQRKIWLGILIGIILMGVAYLVWAVFLNRSTIVINAKAPFTLAISGLRTENCSIDSCSTAVVPGDYNITIKKTGYKDLTKTITVPFGRVYEETVKLEFIPIITQSTKTKAEIFPPEFQLTKTDRDKLGVSQDTKLFFSDAPSGTTPKFVTYISRNETNNRQTLYIATIGDNPTPQIVTSFLRDLQTPVIVPNQTGDKVAVIDQSPDQATLYMIDQQAKNRAAIASYPAIRDLRWIPASNDFIFQARAQTGEPEALFLYRWDDGKTTKLDLNTTLENIAILNKNRILAVTDQSISGDVTDPATLEGSLIALSANTTPTTPAPTSPTHLFIDYSLISNEARLITTLKTGDFPSQVSAAADQKSLYFLQAGDAQSGAAKETVFELKFEE